jgi:hypothetical protein
VAARITLLEVDVDLLVGGDHVVVQIPTKVSAQLGHDHVAVAEQVDVEIDVVNGGPGNVDLGNVGR